MQHKYWKTTKIPWLTITICPPQTWSTNNSFYIRPWLVVCLQLIVKTQENLLERYVVKKKSHKIEICLGNKKHLG